MVQQTGRRRFPDKATPLLVVVEPSAFGQGKSNAVMRMYTELRNRGLRVSGFTLSPIYRTDDDIHVLVGYQGLHLRTGQTYEVAHNQVYDRMKWNKVSVSSQRTNPHARSIIPYSSFQVNPEAVETLLADVAADVGSPDVDAFIIDELSLIMLQYKNFSKGEHSPLIKIVERLVDNPHMVTIIMEPQRSTSTKEFGDAMGEIRHGRSGPERHHLSLTPANFRVVEQELRRLLDDNHINPVLY